MQSMTFDDFVGNKGAVAFVRLLIKRAEADKFIRIPDMAFLGASGHGKTTLARIVANHLCREFCEINSTVIKDPFQFRGYITNPKWRSGVIILLDECHQLKRSIQDNLLSALETPRELHTQHRGQIFMDSLPENVSFVFATTHAGQLRPALRSRLRTIELLEYSEAERQEMTVKYLNREHKLSGSQFDIQAVLQIAKRSREGRHITENCDDIIELMKQKNVTKLTTAIVDETFKIKGIDTYGLSRLDRKLLGYMAEVQTFVGLDTLEAAMNMTKKEIKETLEPWLLRNHFITRHPSGRLITKKGNKALRKK